MGVTSPRAAPIVDYINSGSQLTVGAFSNINISFNITIRVVTETSYWTVLSSKYSSRSDLL